MQPPRAGIEAFCGRSDIDGRTWTHRPWVKHNRVYATNGHVLVECPLFSNSVLEAIGAVINPDKVPNNIADMLANAFAAPTWQPLPELPAFKPCCGCSGTGAFREVYEPIDALGPDGGTCGWCEGYGEEFARIEIGDTGFCIRYLRLLSSLPGVMIAPNWLNTCAFTFDGGRGLLMPMVKP